MISFSQTFRYMPTSLSDWLKRDTGHSGVTGKWSKEYIHSILLIPILGKQNIYISVTELTFGINIIEYLVE